MHARVGGGLVNGRILLVDDEASIRSVLRRILRRRFPDVEVVEAGSAEEALNLTRERPFDVVLTDYRMEGATGADLLRQLVSSSPATARVLATGYQDDSIIEEAVRGLPLHGRLPKPWDNERLLGLLDSLLAERIAARPSAARAREGVH